MTSLRVDQGPGAGQVLPLTSSMTIGRSSPPPANLAGDPQISSRHAQVEPTPDGRVTITDLGSSNGTFVNEVRISGPTSIGPGDRVRMGATVFAIDAAASAPAPAPAAAAAPAVAAAGGGRNTGLIALIAALAALLVVGGVIAAVLLIGDDDKESSAEVRPASAARATPSTPPQPTANPKPPAPVEEEPPPAEENIPGTDTGEEETVAGVVSAFVDAARTGDTDTLCQLVTDDFSINSKVRDCATVSAGEEWASTYEPIDISVNPEQGVAQLKANNGRGDIRYFTLVVVSGEWKLSDFDNTEFDN